MILKNKRGAEKIISVYWFAILFIVAGTIAYSVSIFYGNPYDVREIETGILINKIADCLSENGKLKQNLILDSDFNKEFKILEECSLNFKTKDEEIQYYLEVEFYNFENYDSENKKPLFRIIEGNINLKNSIKYLSSNSIFTNEKLFYILNKKEKVQEGDNTDQKIPKELIVKITSIIRKTEKNVR